MGDDWTEMNEEEQREHFEKMYRDASHKSMRQWDGKTRWRMNLLMGCVVFPLIVVMIGALAVGVWVSGQW
jgi:hypothetical protein